jgi:hypothetical protein
VIIYSIVILCVALVGLLFLKHSITHAPVGFEDEEGFHKGVLRRPAVSPETELQLLAAVVESSARAPKEGFRPRRYFAHASKRFLGHGS